MKTIMTIAALLGLSTLALAQNTTQPAKETMQQRHEKMQRIVQENDPVKRQALWEEHMRAMDENGGCQGMDNKNSMGNKNHGMHHGNMASAK